MFLGVDSSMLEHQAIREILFIALDHANSRMIHSDLFLFFKSLYLSFRESTSFRSLASNWMGGTPRCRLAVGLSSSRLNSCSRNHRKGIRWVRRVH
jgi:hypothetical protein